LEDYTGNIELTVWNEAFTEHEQLLKPGTAISCLLKIIPRDGMVRAIGSDFKPLKPLRSNKPLKIKLDRNKLTLENLTAIKKILQKHQGTRSLVLEIVHSDGSHVALKTGTNFCVDEERSLRKALHSFLSI
jgi:DNA polymerase III alpha subunit